MCQTMEKVFNQKLATMPPEVQARLFIAFKVIFQAVLLFNEAVLYIFSVVISHAVKDSLKYKLCF